MTSKICLVTNLAFVDEPTVENRLMPYIHCLVDKQVHLTLVSQDPTVPDVLPTEVEHISTNLNSNRPSSFIRRAFFEWREARRILKEVSKKNYDKYIVTIPSMFLLFNIYLLKGKSVCLDVRDLTWEYLDDSSIFQKLSKLIFRALAHKNIGLTDYQIVTNDTEFAYMSKMEGIVLKYSNGVTQEQFIDLQRLTKPNPDSTFTITYCGKVGIAQNLSVLIEAASLLPEYNFKIVGYGPQTKEIQLLANEKGLKNVEFTGHVTWSEVLKHYASSHVLYAQLGPLYSGAMPSKLFQYLATGRYVIYGGEGQAVDTLKQFAMTNVIKSNDVAALVDAIECARRYRSKGSEAESNKCLISDNYVREKNILKVLERIL
ncbi:glycosyltransferase [Pseudoalteromonas piscicida]|uniref:glycosyltransferase n=1 Tax=Pseudoalteromonas piscicida TaxID=43662 RepID=UPI0030A2D0FC